jgi:hypothetical protein
MSKPFITTAIAVAVAVAFVAGPAIAQTGGAR